MKRREFLKGTLGGAVFLAGCGGANKSGRALALSQVGRKGCVNSEFGTFRELINGLWVFNDTCNVYLIKRGKRGIAIDFGSGKWLKDLDKTGVKQLDHVFLTHHHSDQCSGLLAKKSWPFSIHAPAGEEKFLDPKYRNDSFYSKYGRGCPDSYSVTTSGIGGIKYDMRDSGDLFWDRQRIRFIGTPGHGANACSVIVDVGAKQVVFCGDAAYEGGTIRQPFHLEWDHYTPKGVLAAWGGIKKLINLKIDLLCPSHGRVVTDKPVEKLKLLSNRLTDFYDSKIYNSAGEKDIYLEPEKVILHDKKGQRGIEKISAHLYQFGINGYLLVSETGQGLIVDPRFCDMEMLKWLLKNELPDVKLDAVLVSHYHLDHCDAVGYLQKTYGVKLYLHPAVQEPLRNVERVSLPWLPAESIIADELWPEKGSWQWNEYNFKIAVWVGQTWGHCGFMTRIDGKKVFFSGDNFFANSRWYGTGGFCAYNGCRFKEGYIPTVELILSWKPDIVAAGHGVYYHFSASKFRKIRKWALQTEKVISELCATGDIEKDYYSLGLAPEDFNGRIPKAHKRYAWIR